jgi:hypothetical protein
MEGKGMGSGIEMMHEELFNKVHSYINLWFGCFDWFETTERYECICAYTWYLRTVTGGIGNIPCYSATSRFSLRHHAGMAKVCD